MNRTKISKRLRASTARYTGYPLTEHAGIPYISSMDAPEIFDWDDTKAKANEAKHGVTFEFALGVFLDENRLDLDTFRPEDNEQRRKVIGLIEGRLYTVVYTMRGGICRLISARRSNAKEGRNYGQKDP